MTTDIEVLGAGKYVRLVKRGRWEYCERINTSGVAVLIPITDTAEVVLVEQHRMAVDAPVLEWPAGLVGDEAEFADESVETAAARELFEETGYEAQQIDLLFRGPPSAGILAEQPHFYLATGLKRIGPGGGDESEDITVHVVPIAEVETFIAEKSATGVKIEAKLYTGLYFAHRHLGNLQTNPA